MTHDQIVLSLGYNKPNVAYTMVIELPFLPPYKSPRHPTGRRGLFCFMVLVVDVYSTTTSSRKNHAG